MSGWVQCCVQECLSVPLSVLHSVRECLSVIAVRGGDPAGAEAAGGVHVLRSRDPGCSLRHPDANTEVVSLALDLLQ